MANIETVTINWSEHVILVSSFEHSTNPYLSMKGFYCILSGVLNPLTSKYHQIKLLYIGKAFEQNLKDRIPQEHPAYDCVEKYVNSDINRTILINVGVIVGVSHAKNITQELFSDIECCLIKTNQPHCNTQCKENHTGRTVQINNTGGYYPLKEKSACTSELK